MFDVRRLVALQEVARCGSLSAAAACLSYTTSAVSQQITSLERDVGATLLVRGPSGARLTPAGARLIDHADTILGAIAAAERDLAVLATAQDSRLRVASFASAAATILPRVFARFRTLRPDVELELVSADPEEGAGLLAANGADVAVITSVPAEGSTFSGLHTVAVYDDEFFVVLPESHRLAGLTEVPFAALAGEHWVVSTATGTCPDVRVFQRACSQAGFTPKVTFRAEEYSTVQGLVAANLGVSLVPSLAVGTVRADVLVRRVAQHRPVRRISLATVEQPGSHTALASFLSLTRSIGLRLNAEAVFSVPARPSSVA